MNIVWIEYAGLMYYTDGDNGKTLKLKFIFIKDKDNQNQHFFDTKLEQTISDQNFKTYTLLNEFYKINPDRFIFASTTDYTKLYIYLIQQYNWYQYVKIMKFSYTLSSTTSNIRFNKEFNFGIYKGFLVFTATISSNQDNATDFSSYLIFFGYANGTDFTDDVTEYFADIEGYDSNNDFAKYLLDHVSVDNNIFSYNLIRKVKLISIPPEILIYQKNDLNNPIPDGTIIDEGNYVLYQNKKLTKTHKLYQLDYQYIVQEPLHDTFFSGASELGTLDDNGKSNFKKDYEKSRQTLYGRVNRLTMKLCHKYCGTCYEYGKDNNNQKCLSCLEPYTYDYFSYFNIFLSNCVPEGYYNDREKGTLEECQGKVHKFYLNKTDDKRICFKESYECPDVYHFLNETMP